MKNRFLIAVGKTLSNLSLTLNLGSGSTWPGHFALRANPHFIRHLLKDSKTKIVLVAGTNGKTTTSTLIKHILEKSGNKVIQNTSGANLLNGIASTLLLNTNKHGKLDADYAIFEVDENSLAPLLKELTPDTVILLNLFRDQLDRYGEVNSIVEKWSKALETLPATTTLLLNADDPEIAYLGMKGNYSSSEQRESRSNSETMKSSNNSSRQARTIRENTFYFGLSDKKLGQTSFQHASDSIYCPKCHTKLIYETRFFSHVGIWHCPKCGLKRPNLSLENISSYPLSGIYNMYNTNAAILFVNLNNISNETIEQSLNSFTAAFGRQEIVKYYGKNIQLFLSKNPTSFNQSLRTIQQLGAKHLLLVLNDRGPDGRDVSWIWDTDIDEYIQSMEHIYVSGDRVYDMALRLKYADIPQEKIQTYEKLEEAITEAVVPMPKEKTLYILPTYSAMLETRKIITGRKIL